MKQRGDFGLFWGFCALVTTWHYHISLMMHNYRPTCIMSKIMRVQNDISPEWYHVISCGNNDFMTLFGIIFWCCCLGGPLVKTHPCCTDPLKVSDSIPMQATTLFHKSSSIYLSWMIYWKIVVRLVVPSNKSTVYLWCESRTYVSDSINILMIKCVATSYQCKSA